MIETRSKKMLPFYILEVLRRYTDSEHRLTQKEILDLLERDNQIEVDRKTLKRNLSDLIDFGFDIEYSGIERKNSEGEVEVLKTDLYLNRDITDSELHLLIDGLIFSRQIPANHKKRLIDKLSGISSKYFKSSVKYVRAIPEIKSTNQQLFYTIEVLDEAIAKKRRVSVKMGNYNTKGKLIARTDEYGNDKIYTIDPYQMVASDGKYYLICCNAKYETISHYRLDRMLDIEIKDEKVRPLTSLPGYEQGLNLPKHMAEHLYMYSGESIKVRFRIQTDYLNQVYDWFGDGIRFENEMDGEVDVVLSVNEQAMLYWALQFDDAITVLEPESLRLKLKEAGASIAKKYK